MCDVFTRGAHTEIKHGDMAYSMPEASPAEGTITPLRAERGIVNRLAVATRNMTTHCRHSGHSTGDQGSTTALLFIKILLHPAHNPPAPTHQPTLHSSPTIMAHPTHLLMIQYVWCVRACVHSCVCVHAGLCVCVYVPSPCYNKLLSFQRNSP